MFGLSLPKILLLLFILIIIWQIFKIIEKKQKLKENHLNSDDQEDQVYEPLIECSNCGNFYSRNESKVCPVCGTKNN